MFVGLGAVAMTSFLLPFLTRIISLALSWAFQEMCYAAGDPAEQTSVADLIGREQRGQTYNLYVKYSDRGAAVGPFAGAWLYQTCGGAIPFNVNGTLLAICAFIRLVFLKLPAKGLRTKESPVEKMPV